MTLIHRASFCLLCIFILLSCSSGGAIKVSSNSDFSAAILHEDTAVQLTELKPRQLKARPRVIRRNQPYYRPNLRKYPRGAVYSRYKVPPMYVTYRCPPKVGLLLCRASCEKRSRNVLGSCDNGYCTCLLLTPGFRGSGVFARRANCATQTYKCHRFCVYQFGNSAYGSCRGSICRCFTNPGISLRNQSTACDQARRRLAYLEARVRTILGKRPSERTASDIRLLRQVAKAPKLVNRIARPSSSPKNSRYSSQSGEKSSSRKDKRPSSSKGKDKQPQGRRRREEDEEGDERDELDFQDPRGQLLNPAAKPGYGQYPQVPGKAAVGGSQKGGRGRLTNDPRQQNHLGRDDPANYPGNQYLDPEGQAQVEDPRYRLQSPQQERFDDLQHGQYGHTQRPGQEGSRLDEGACPLKQGQRNEQDQRDPRDPRDPRSRDEEIEKLAEFEEEVDPAVMKQFEDVLQGVPPIRDAQSELAAEKEYDQYRRNPVYGDFLDHMDHQYRQREEPPPERVSRNAAQADRLII